MFKTIQSVELAATNNFKIGNKNQLNNPSKYKKKAQLSHQSHTLTTTSAPNTQT